MKSNVLTEKQKQEIIRYMLGLVKQRRYSYLTVENLKKEVIPYIKARFKKDVELKDVLKIGMDAEIMPSLKMSKEKFYTADEIYKDINRKYKGPVKSTTLNIIMVLIAMCMFAVCYIVGLVDFITRTTINYSNSPIELAIAYSLVAASMYGNYLIFKLAGG